MRFIDTAAAGVGRALESLGLYEEERTPRGLRYRSGTIDYLRVYLRKDFVGEVSLVVAFSSCQTSFSETEIANWAGIPVPDLVALDENAERRVLDWMENLVRERYGAILSGDPATLSSLHESILIQGRRLTHESNRRSAESAARIAAQQGDAEAVVRYLSPFSEELDEASQRLLAEAMHRSPFRDRRS